MGLAVFAASLMTWRADAQTSLADWYSGGT